MLAIKIIQAKTSDSMHFEIDNSTQKLVEHFSLIITFKPVLPHYQCLAKQRQQLVSSYKSRNIDQNSGRKGG